MEPGRHFPDDGSWEESFKQLGEDLKHLGNFNGRLFESPETLLGISANGGENLREDGEGVALTLS